MTKKAILALTAMLLAFGTGWAQQQSPSTLKKEAPTLGFAHLTDTPSIIDSDALDEEHELEKKLPGNPLVKDKRAVHETAMMQAFVEGFQNSKECNGITFQMGENKKPQFVVQVMVKGHDKTPDDQTWTWMLFWPGDPSPADKQGHGMGGLGIQASAKLTAKDVCTTLWEDVDPNHFKKPGGKIER